MRVSFDRAEGGARVADGVWSMVLEVAFDGVVLSAPVPAPAKPIRLDWKRRGLPIIAKPLPDGRLRIVGFWRRVQEAVRRRLRR